MNWLAPQPSLAEPSAPDANHLALARAIETDRIYFELGAQVERLPGADLAWMPGLTRSPAAAVIQRVKPEVVAAVGEAWVDRVERELARLGTPFARIYLDQADTAASSVLRRAGYTPRDEIAFAGTLPQPALELVLHPVTDSSDWARKLRLHQEAAERPDGHLTAASDWVRLEHEKCRAGMQAFLAEAGDATVGAINLVRGDDIARLKNIVVHPRHRRRGIALAMLAGLAAIAREQGFEDACIFAVRGGIGERLYRAAGLRDVGAQVEWSKDLTSC